jgi:bifunctional DNA-binding transcriptional regulator/antitoxin component of YhaV-PrlF toxin-antitoxin module
MRTSKVNSDGTVTVPMEICESLGVHVGDTVEFLIVGYQLEMRIQDAKRPTFPGTPVSGYGMIKSNRPPVPVDFDPAEILK